MDLVINSAAIAVFAVLVGVIVWIGLTIVTRSEPNTLLPKPIAISNAREKISGIVILAGLWVFVAFTVEAQQAFGAPVGDRLEPTVDILQIAECERPTRSFGLIQSCVATGFRYVDESGQLRFDHPGKVTTRSPLEPGDLVAQYHASGWERWIQPLGSDTTWRAVADEDRPNLAWLPISALIVGLLVCGSINRAIARRRQRRDPVASSAAGSRGH